MKKIFTLFAGIAMAATAAAEAPTPVQDAWFYPGIDGVSMGVSYNTAYDVVVLYNTYCDRSTEGMVPRPLDIGLFGTPAINAKVGDVIPVPADYTPTFDFPGAPAPTNAGTVGYVGRVGTGQLVEINGLEPGTQYFMAIYTRNADGEYSTPYYTGTSTYLQCPYSSESYNFPRVQLPWGWYSDSDIKFTDRLFWDETEKKVTQGTQPIQQWVEIPFGTTAKPVETTLEVPMVNVNTADAVAIFEYNIRKGTGLAYNDWNEGDVLAIRVSTDGGSEWVNVAEYTAAKHPTQAEDTDYERIIAPLENYSGKNVQMQLYWKTSAPEGTAMSIDRVSIDVAIGAATQLSTPKNLSADVTTLAEEGKVVLSWDAVEDAVGYEVAYKEAEAEEWIVKATQEPTITLSDLKEGAEYVWKVLANSGSVQVGSSDYSDEATFTAPKTNGVAAVEAEETVTVMTIEGIVVLRNAERAALATLPDGFYIVNGKKYLLRK